MHTIAPSPHPDVADILLRVSSLEQANDDRYSLPTQEAQCRALCARSGWRVHSVEQDAITGEYIERPGFQRVLADLDARKVGRVVIYDVDRAGRDTYVGATLLHSCKEAGATLHVVQMPDLDLTTPFGEMMFFFRLTQAAQELASTRERTQRGRRARVDSGKIIVPPTPLFGYLFTDDKSGYVPHPVYAPIVVRIYEEVAAGRTLRAIAAGLNADGIPTRSQIAAEETAKPSLSGMHGTKGNGRRRVARLWSRAAIQGIIRHTGYSGEPTAYREAWEHGVVRDEHTGEARVRWSMHPRPLDEQVKLPTTTWPPLVSAELAARARARTTANREEAARRMPVGEAEATLLRSGYVFCLPCGCRMATCRYRRNGNHKWAYFCRKCRQSINAEALDEPVWAHVERLAADKTVTERALSRWHRATAQRLARMQAGAETARRIHATAQADIERLVRAIGREDDARVQDLLRRELKKADLRAQKAGADIEAHAARLAANPALAQMADLEAWATEWRGRVHAADWGERRQALHRLGLRVFLAPRDSMWSALTRTGQRYFEVVLGWPHGVKQAVPGDAVPLGGPMLYDAALTDGGEVTDESLDAALLDPTTRTHWLVPAEQYGAALKRDIAQQGGDALEAVEGQYKSALGSLLGEEFIGEVNGPDRGGDGDGEDDKPSATVSASTR